MSFNKKFFTTGGIVASAPPAAAAFDPLQNFETVTYTGNGSTQKITGYIRKGGAFNGSTSYIRTSYTIPAISTYSLSLWFRTSITGVRQYLFADFNSVANTSSVRLSLAIAANNNFEFYLGNGSSNWTDSSSASASSYLDGDWHNLVLAINGTSVKLYADGNSTPIADLTSTVSAGTAGTSPLSIGRIGDYSGLYFNGSIDQVRIFNTELNSTQAGQLAAEDYTDPKKSTTDYFGNGSGVALYELDDDANSSNFEQAAVFNGSSSGIQTGIQQGTNPFTWSVWLNPADITTNQYAIGVYNSANNHQYHIKLQSSNFVLTAYNGATYSFSTSANINEWAHLVLTYDGTGIEAYKNGVSLGAKQNFSALSLGGKQTLLGGVQNTGDSVQQLFYNGKIDQVRIYSSALSSGDVTNLYNESSVPTSTLVAHYKLDGNAEDVLDTYDGTETSITYSTGVYGGTPTNINFLGMAFQPDLVWIKNRFTTNPHVLTDSIRGAGINIYSNLTNGNTDESAYFTSFDSNGFSLALSGGNTNATGSSYVAWCWKAGGAAVSGTGTGGASSVSYSANTAAGFSIVKYTKSGTSGTMTHGLTAAPEIILEKRIDGSAYWNGRVEGVTANNQTLYLNQSAEVSTHPSLNLWTTPTTSVFGYDSANATAGNYIAYCFHSVDEYQKIGSYSGTGASGITITTGFQPRFVMIKATNNASDWYIIDAVRPNNKFIIANGANSEFTASDTHTFTSTGFTLSGSSYNNSGYNWIYLAIA
jgi:hypothetical protein